MKNAGATPSSPLVPASLRRSALFLALAMASSWAMAAEPVAADIPAADAATPDAGMPDGATPSSDNRHRKAVDLDAIVVTANPLGQSADSLSQPVEVLAGERLDEARGATLGETVGRLPGVQSSNFGSGVGRPIIRGLDGPRVSVLSGGMGTQDVSTVSQDHNVTVEPFLADQIEVLKGPSTLLYGSGAIGGVVNAVDGRIAERPLDEVISGRAELRHETVSDGFTGMGRIDASGADGALVIHADGVYRNLKDYETPLGVQPNSFVDTKTGALGASLVGDAGFLGFSVARYEDRYGNPGEPGDIANGERGVYIDMQQNQFTLKGGLNRDFGIFDSLRASIAHSQYEHTEYEGEEVGTVFLNDATEGRVELTHKPLAGWTGAIGVQGYTREFQAIGEEAFIPRTQTDAGGLFVVEKKTFGKFQLDAGARVDSVKSSPDSAPSRSFTPLSASVGGLWKFADKWRLTANLNHAERAPAEEELFADGPHIATESYEIGDAQLDTEQANQAELGVGFDSRWFSGKANLYQTHFKGFIYLVDTGDVFPRDEGDLPIRQWTQADATFRGFEVEGTVHMVDNATGKLDLRLFADHVRGTLDAGGYVPRLPPSRQGGELRWTGNAWRAAVGAIRYDPVDDVAVGETPTAGYTMVDAHLAYHFDLGSTGLEMFLDGNNLTNQVGRVSTSFLKDTVVLPGRNVTLGVRVFF